MLLAVSLFFLSGIYASAVPPQGELIVARAVNCKVVTGVVSAIKVLGAPATAFCSAYLHIPATVTVPYTVTPTVTRTAPAVTITVSDPGCTPATPTKRNIALDERTVPIGLAKYGAAEISSACQCLSLQPKTTKTSTVTGGTQTNFVTPTATSTVCIGRVCTPLGQPCIFEQPELCCSQTCACISGVCNCYAFP